MRVRIIEKTGALSLTKEVNDFLSEKYRYKRIIDIKYSTATYDGLYLYSAMIVYEE